MLLFKPCISFHLKAYLYDTSLGTKVYCICYIYYLVNCLLLADCNVLYSSCQQQQISCCTWFCDTGMRSVCSLYLLSVNLHPHFLFSHSLNFPRGKGPLKNSSDVINAAKKIAEAGSRMDKLARAVADQVVLQLNLCLSLSFLTLYFPSI